MRHRVCFIVTKSEIGGAQKWVKEQIQALSNQFDLHLVTDKEGWLTEETSAAGRMLDERIQKRVSLSFLFKFYRYLKETGIDVVVASSANAGIYGRLVKLLLGTRVKVVYVSHGWSAIYNGGKLKAIYKFIELLLSFMTNSVLCVSKSDFRKAVKEIKISPQKLVLIQNKISPTERVKKRLNSEFKLLTVARLEPPKRVDLLIKSIKGLNCKLYVVGAGGLRDSLESLCVTNNIQNVVFLGEISGFDRFCDYDAFALISDSEGLPISALEAMSAGLPLVLSNVGGCQELIQNNGAIVDNTPEAIKIGITDVMAHYETYQANSLRLFEETFSLVNNAYVYVDFYKSLASGKRDMS